MFDGAHLYMPESLSVTLGKLSVDDIESLPTLSSKKERPTESTQIAAIEFSTPLPVLKRASE